MERLGERYELEAALGQGRSTVYRAVDTRLQREVAIKRVALLAGHEDVEQVRTRALREAHASARLNNPSTVAVYDVVEEDGAIWLVMELVDGPSLAQIVEDDGPLTHRRAAAIGLGVLTALEAAHLVGVIHRDVKPANVLVPVGDRAKLTDFGVATIRDESRVTATGLIVGSPSYMAPEQATGGEISGATDLWALGALLYVAVEGVPPFQAATALATATAVVHAEPRPQQNHGPLDQVIGRLLVKDPAARASGGEVRAALMRVSRGSTIAPRSAAAGATTVATPVVGPAATPATGTAAASAPGSAATAGPAATGAGSPAPGAATPEPGSLATVASTAAASLGRALRPASRGRGRPAPVQPAAPAGGDPSPQPAAAAPGPGDGGGTAVRARRPAPADAAAERSRMPAVLLALGVLMLVVAAAIAVPALSSDGGNRAGDDGSRSSAGADGALDDPGEVADDPSADTSEPPGADTSTTDAPPGALPAGWSPYRDPQGAYTIGLPPGWRVEPTGAANRVDVVDPATGSFLRIEWTAMPGADPAQAWRELALGFATRNANYRELGIAPASYRDYDAALWEFTHGGGETLHTGNLGFVTAGRGYALMLRTPERLWDSSQSLFEQFKRAFQPT